MQWRKWGAYVAIAAMVVVGGLGWVRYLAAQSKTPSSMFDQKLTQEQLKSLLEKYSAPNTKGPNWRQLSKDVGLEISNDPRLGLRGHLYVLVEGRWYQVTMATPGDLADAVPAR